MCLLNVLRLHIVQNQRQKRLYKKYAKEYANAEFARNEIRRDEFTMVSPEVWNHHRGCHRKGAAFSADVAAASSTSTSPSSSPSSSTVFMMVPSSEECFESCCYFNSCSNCDSGRFSSLCCTEYIMNGNQHLDDDEKPCSKSYLCYHGRDVDAEAYNSIVCKYVCY